MRRNCSELKAVAMVLEINWGSPEGLPLILGGIEMRFIRAKLLDRSPECIVLISETPMWDDYPQEYSQFLSDLSDAFPQSKLYYFGSFNNDVSEDLGSKICSVEVSSLDPQDFKNRSII